MIRNLKLLNFKSWKETGDIEFAPITGVFGANSSGKSSLLQFLLMLKQTVEDTDRFKVLNFGDIKSGVDLGSFQSVLHNRDLKKSLDFVLIWDAVDFKLPIEVSDIKSKEISFKCSIGTIENSTTPLVKSFEYQYSTDIIMGLDLGSENLYEYWTAIRQQRSHTNSGILDDKNPFRFYNFPRSFYQQELFKNWISEFPTHFEKTLQRIKYVGPLREYPARSYKFSGTSQRVTEVGSKGENTINALISWRSFFPMPPISIVNDRKQSSYEAETGQSLKKLGLADDFVIEEMAENPQQYIVYFQHTPNSYKITIADMGFGVSQVLPILVQCAIAQEGDILIFEQPEMHLHPSAQYELADVFINTIKEKNVQIIFESHSEYLLYRLMRRLAEEKISQSEINLYFTDISKGESIITPLDIDPFGNIKNWPEDFFGDQMEDIAERSLAEIKRKKKEGGEK